MDWMDFDRNGVVDGVDFFILNEIFALLLIAVLLLSSNYGVNSGSWNDLLTRRSYEQSEYFQTQSVNQATRAIRAAVRATRFEEDGVYNPHRFVNISEYAETGVITAERSKSLPEFAA